jgi:hypothetical protein
MNSKLTESNLRKIVRRVISERDSGTEIFNNISYDEDTELIDDVIMRIKEHGDDYKRALNKLNLDYPTGKYRKLPLLKRGDVKLPPNVKVKSTYPNDKN